jgi:hypothetical protein
VVPQEYLLDNGSALTSKAFADHLAKCVCVSSPQRGGYLFNHGIPIPTEANLIGLVGFSTVGLTVKYCDPTRRADITVSQLTVKNEQTGQFAGVGAHHHNRID